MRRQRLHEVVVRRAADDGERLIFVSEGPMSKDSLSDRRNALEESFFARKNEQLLRELRNQLTDNARRAALAKASGINNEQLLDQMVEMDIRPETLAALSLVPLVVVAWADKVMEPREKQAILRAAHDAGIEQGDPGYQLLEQWFEHKPSDEMVDTWKAYVHTLTESLTGGGCELLRDEVIGRAHKIAAASGGVLGLGSKISRVEKATLDELSRAFDKKS